MPRGVPKNKTVTAGEPAVIDMTATQISSEDTIEPVEGPLVDRYTDTFMEDDPTPDKAYYVLTLVNDHTRDLVKRLEKSGMDFQIVEMSEDDMKDVRNGNLMFLPKS